jgi:hypothetical protein
MAARIKSARAFWNILHINQGPTNYDNWYKIMFRKILAKAHFKWELLMIKFAHKGKIGQVSYVMIIAPSQSE